MKFQFIHAHYDDYEFTAGGAFEIARRRLGDTFSAEVTLCTDGRAGHHFRTREETGAIRLAEQEKSAALGRYAFKLLEYPDGGVPREGCIETGRQFLAALWKVTRDFQPNYLFCPPIPSDPLAGVHPDHLDVAEAIRKIAYMINVPHAFTPEYPADETQSESIKVPVIINVYDGYMGAANAFDFAVDVTEAFDLIAEMTWSHQSQIMEWLPWVGSHNVSAPKDFEAWKGELTKRFRAQQEIVGAPTDKFYEFFTVSGWGSKPRADELLRDFPTMETGLSNLDRF